MILTKIQQSTFQVEKLKSVVGIGRSAAYQVIITPGEDLGAIGPVAEFAITTASNANEFSRQPAFRAGAQHVGSWLLRMLKAPGR